MVNEVVLNILNTTINSFDFSYCFAVNVATYITIKWYLDSKHKHKLTTWNKRTILVLISCLLAVVYYLVGCDVKVLTNSFILAPVSWSWIFKPICKKFNIDYSSKEFKK